MQTFKSVSPLNPEQNDAIAYALRVKSRQCVLIDAPAGTGKTTTLTAMHCAMKDAGRRVLSLCYSKSGAKRFNSLLAKIATSTTGKIDQGMTIDAFALWCLEAYGSRELLPRRSIREALADGDRLSLIAIRESVESLNARHEQGDPIVPERLSTTDASLFDALELIDNLKISLVFENFTGSDRDLYDEDFEDIAGILNGLSLPPYAFSLFLNYENRRVSMDFMRIIDAAYILTQDVPAIQRCMQTNRIFSVLVDEGHDTKPVHHRVLTYLNQSGCALVIAGDEAQDIFSWRGIKPFSVFAELRAHAQPETRRFTQTYRFGNDLAPAVQEHLSRIHRKPVLLTPAAHNTPIMHLAALYPGIPDAERLAAWMADLSQSDEKFRSVMCIVPTPHHAYPQMMVLHSKGCPIYCTNMFPPHLCSESLLARAFAWICDANLSQEPSALDAQGIALLLHSPWAATKPHLTAWLSEIEILENFKPKYYVSDMVPNIAQLVREELRLPEGLPLADKLHFALLSCKISAWLNMRASNQANAKASIQWMTKQQQQLVAQGGTAYCQYWDGFALYFENPQPGQWLGFVPIVHAKGMQWDTVIMRNANWDAYSAPTASMLQLKEFYVGISRTQKLLVRA